MYNLDSIFSNAFIKSKDGLIILRDDVIVMCNNRAKKILNITTSDYEGRSLYDFSTSKRIINNIVVDLDKVVFDDILKNEINKIEWEFNGKNNLHYFVHIEVYHFTNDDGNFIFLVLKDITTRKKFDLMLNARLALIQRAGSYTLNQLLQKTLEEIVLLTESELGFYYTFSCNFNTLKLKATVSNNSGQITKNEIITVKEEEQFIIDSLRKDNSPLISNNTHKKHVGKPFWNCEIEKELLVPVTRNGELKAVVGLANKQWCYSKHDSVMAKVLVDLMWDLAEKKQAELALAESETKFKNVFDSTSFGVAICQLNGKIQSANKAFCDVVGCNFKKMDGLNLYKIIHPEDKIDNRSLQKLYTGELLHYKAEKRIIDLSESIKWVNIAINIHKYLDSDSKVLIAIIEDISEKKIAAFELKKSEERFKLLSSIANEGICIHDEGVIVDANEALARILKVDSIKELIGLNFIESEFIPEDGRALLKETIYERKEKVYDIEAFRKDGKKINIELIGRNFYYNGKDIRLGSIRDITERKLAENALLNSERNFREFFDNSIISLFVFAEDGSILKANDHACRMLGYSLKQLQKMNILDLHPESEVESAILNFQRILSGEINSCSIPFITKTSQIIPVSTHIGRGKWNNQDALFCVGKDLTDLKISEEKFNKAFHKNGMAMIIASKASLQIVEVNEQAKKILGYTFNDFEKQSRALLIEAKDTKFNQNTVELAANGDVNDLLFMFRKSDGDFISANVNIANISIQGEKYLLISFVDVTEKLKTENALINSEVRLKEITENVQEGIILANLQFRYVFVNNTFSRMTGYSKEELLGMYINEIVVHPEDLAMANKLVTAGGSVVRRYVAMRKKDGTVFYINVSAKNITIGGESFILGTQQDVTQEYLAEQNLLKAYEEITSLKNQLEQENLILREEISKTHSFSEIVTNNSKFRHTLSQIEIVSPTNASVLIIGETGTGKELVARAIHEKSRRNNKPLVKLNCAAIPESLIESELFGHEKGAFTGAFQQKIGRFEVANGGTLFLDEIGEMPVDLQSKLLRVLQEGEFERIGGSKTIKVDVRIIAATNRDLNIEIEKGNFRLDLFYRLNVFPVELPPLRERIDDISTLTHHFVSKFNKKLDKNITQIPVKVMDDLMNYEWPGNIRELENMIERAMILTKGNSLKLDSILLNKAVKSKPRFKSFDEMQRSYIEDVLSYTNWKISGRKGATEILKLKYSTLASKMQKLGIRKPD